MLLVPTVADEITSFSARDPSSTAHSPQCTQCLTPGKDKTVDRQRSACMCGQLQHETEKNTNSIICVIAHLFHLIVAVSTLMEEAESLQFVPLRWCSA